MCINAGAIVTGVISISNRESNSFVRAYLVFSAMQLIFYFGISIWICGALVTANTTEVEPTFCRHRVSPNLIHYLSITNPPIVLLLCIWSFTFRKLCSTDIAKHREIIIIIIMVSLYKIVSPAKNLILQWLKQFFRSLI